MVAGARPVQGHSQVVEDDWEVVTAHHHVDGHVIAARPAQLPVHRVPPCRSSSKVTASSATARGTHDKDGRYGLGF